MKNKIRKEAAIYRVHLDGSRIISKDQRTCCLKLEVGLELVVSLVCTVFSYLLSVCVCWRSKLCCSCNGW